jgi:hypothetical protein
MTDTEAIMEGNADSAPLAASGNLCRSASETRAAMKQRCGSKHWLPEIRE